MEDLIEDVLILARQGKQGLEPTAVDLGAVATRAWNNARTAEASLRTEVDCTVSADERRLQQLLENLFCNAVEHGREDATVRVDRVADGFYVADDGPGVPEDGSGSIFDRGYSTAAEGTGLGLTIVADVAEAHDWDYEVTAAADGGARFEFTGVELS